jgi:hypothetical protein
MRTMIAFPVMVMALLFRECRRDKASKSDKMSDSESSEKKKSDKLEYKKSDKSE